MAKIYVASSWRNEYQPETVEQLRGFGHEVYDFRNPQHGRGGFRWSDIDANWENWSVGEYLSALENPVAESGFACDFDAMEWADVCVLVLPCGRSAHAEAGWMQGAGKPVVVYIPEKQEPERMYKLFSLVTDSLEKADDYIRSLNIM